MHNCCLCFKKKVKEKQLPIKEKIGNKLPHCSLVTQRVPCDRMDCGKKVFDMCWCEVHLKLSPRSIDVAFSVIIGPSALCLGRNIQNSTYILGKQRLMLSVHLLMHQTFQ